MNSPPTASCCGRSLTSLYRVAVGFVLGTGAGMFVGLGAGLVPGIRHFFDPLVSFLYAVPKIAFLPIFLLLFGLGHESKIAIIAFSCFFPVFIASRHAALSVGKLLVWTARNMGAPRSTMFFRVFIPAAAPQLFSGARIGLAHSLRDPVRRGTDGIAGRTWPADQLKARMRRGST